MEYQLPTAIQNRLAQTGETPESFISRAVDVLVRKEMAQGFNDLPREAPTETAAFLTVKS